MQYDSDYEVRLATLGAMGGNTGVTYDSVYDIDLEILRLTEQGGGGGGTGTSIDDNVIATNKTWSSSKINNQLSGKQNTLTAGTNISIDNGVISAQQPSLEGYATIEDLNNGLSFKQGTLTAGTGIQIVNDVISSPSEIDDLHAGSDTTYSSNKIIELTQGLGFDVEIVQALPQTGDAQTIYMLPKADSAATDVYDEYIYTNNAWEKIGNTQTDLSQYYTKSETDTLLNGKQTTLTAGTGIQIVDNVISATGGGGGTELSAGTNISIVNNKINANGYSYDPSYHSFVAGGQMNSLTRASSSLVCGYMNTAYTGIYGFIYGTENRIEGNSNLVGGYKSTGKKSWTVAIGYSATTDAYGAVSIGKNVASNNNWQFSCGLSTSPHTGTRFVVGIGNDNATDRKNAIEIMDSGDTYVYGVGGYDGKNLSGSTLQTVINSKVGSTSVATIWTGSQADYDLITTKDPNTLYIIN